MQKKSHSLIEVCIGTAIGFIISLCIQYWIFSQMGIESSHKLNLVITAIFTAASIVRGYFVRRLFNGLHHRDTARKE